MGKYDEPLVDEAQGLRFIANELATANELKKIEIELMADKQGFTKDWRVELKKKMDEL